MRFKYEYKPEGEDPHNFSCQLQCNRCTANNKSGSRCKNRVCIGTTVCHAHRKQLGLRVKKSTIPDAGKGLFATRKFKKNEIIGQYGGEVISGAEVTDRYSAGTAPYTLKIGANRYVDSACKRTLMSTANSKKVRSHNNAKFSTVPTANNNINVRATKTIQPGSEIYVFYGDGYWNTVADTNHTTK